MEHLSVGPKIEHRRVRVAHPSPDSHAGDRVLPLRAGVARPVRVDEREDTVVEHHRPKRSWTSFTRPLPGKVGHGKVPPH
eukprot:5409114-Prymnesium_polylepis.1